MSSPPPAPVVCGPGDALVQSVAAIVRGAKAGDPFHPVIVVVQRGRHAVLLRRSLARALGGIVNVEVATPGRLVAARLDAPAHRPASPAAITAAVARAARSSAGPLRPSSRQPATLATLTAVYRELRAAAADGLDTLGRRGALGAQLAAIVAGAHQHLRAAGRADEVDVLASLSDAVRSVGGGAAPAVVVIVDEPLEPGMRGALGKVIVEHGAHLVLALSGDPLADDATRASAAALAPGAALERDDVDGAPHTTAAVSAATLTISSSTDPDAEVADAVRWLVARWRADSADMPAALLWTADQPYRRIVAEHLQRASLDWSGPAGGSLIETHAGRAVQRAARAIAGAARASASMASLASVASGAPDAPSDGLSERAGVPSSWAGWAARLEPLVVDDRAVATVVADLAALDGLDGFEIDHAADLLTLVLEGTNAQHGTMSRGITVGLLAGPTLVGHYGAIAVVGLAEGWAPAAEPAGGLLSSDDRAAIGLLPPGRAVAQRRALATIVASAEHVLASWPRADLRRTATRSPSRWLEPLTHQAARSGTLVEHIDKPSHLGALIRDGPGTPAEHRVLMALRAPDALADDDAVFAGALVAARARAGNGATAFDGNLADEDLTMLRQRTRPWTATELEAYASCPRTYFVRHVLGVGSSRLADELLREDSRTKGSAAHDVLHRLLGAERDGDRLELASLIDAAHDLLHARELATASATTAPGRLRDHRRAELARRLAMTVVHDRAARHDAGREPVAFEISFGDRGDVAVELPDGRCVPIRGRIDRVDRHRDGSLAVVDYKTGVPKGFGDDPLNGGARLQLALYLIGAHVAFGTAASSAEYRFVDLTPNVRPIDAEALLANLAPTVAALVDSIEAGWFVGPPHEPRAPGQPVCDVCDPYGLFGALLARRDALLTEADSALADLVAPPPLEVLDRSGDG